MKYLLTNQTENGSGDGQVLANSLLFGKGLTVIAWGTDTTFTANGIAKAEINPDLSVQVRGTVSSVGAGTDLNLAIL